ncbi:hypothetical protein A3D80_00520 [Candidatus Roizmanbacteria bacterium RIFCSPHIGHO2_02_FULL_40_13b]|uniref:Uncharacterized protein n=1 Tax=Candidatus Roizmanbacteria bacterium RIFCSPHIGHO2_01_FULL_39_24 TaxID=1802032 RepID=A0A1F7GLD5_9BACT|nr:MAG: hypothetical protein A2799_02485 [Candidatus Roizmanbacteria bacterium RIFCSPHIGHO2_01_FULL_39_24]OGK27431.1 MAG: hypothetical protein A3D80_00520 [Candidatus Roizmanbacteria bacterium RIFCSPHIGHO2_02_FULL_40_13b]OGK50424.1 MAG: hypothetical protein A3A56_02230 [Candidatus Roizmanbacteria bacterium RIFCSPLOWO2_01_FULL_40_32]OGK56979.1 MAG: hypothetical protein A3H83_00380 [Candidatus Roizmanbacteria bacterium RIFCSPLOWO2_02_FULL_39_8]
MDTKAPEFIYIAFVLPSLFALTFMFEGLYKMVHQEDGFFIFIVGIVFLVIIALAYLFLFK